VRIILFFLLFVLPAIAQEPPTTNRCTEGRAHRVVRMDEPNHVIVSLQEPVKEEGKEIVATWRRLLQRIPDVRLTTVPADADIVLDVTARKIEEKDSGVIFYVWSAIVSYPWRVSCEVGKQPYYLEQQQLSVSMWTSSITGAADSIQEELDSIEEQCIQAVRNLKRK